MQRYKQFSDGFAYLVVLTMLAALGFSLEIVTEEIQHAAQREKEQQLLFVGKQYRQAIESYYEKSPGTKQYPKTLDQLIEDNRFPKAIRHLRKIYADPMMPLDAENKQARFQLVYNQQGFIIGVASQSKLKPIMTNLDEGLLKAADQKPVLTYADWKFVYLSPDGQSAAIKSDNTLKNFDDADSDNESTLSNNSEDKE